MGQSLARHSATASFVHAPSLADFITTIVGFEVFGTHSHLLVDTLGLLLLAVVHSADIQDRDGGILLLATMKGLFPFLEKLFADSAYQGPSFTNHCQNPTLSQSRDHQT